MLDGTARFHWAMPRVSVKADGFVLGRWAQSHHVAPTCPVWKGDAHSSPELRFLVKRAQKRVLFQTYQGAFVKSICYNRPPPLCAGNIY